MSFQVQDSYPLSPMQQGMLFNHLKDPGSGVDIEQLVVHMPEEVDLGRLERAWTWLAARHAVLRTRFAWEEGEPRQEVLGDVPVRLDFEDAADRASDRQEVFRSFLEADRLRSFDLAELPLFRLTCFRWGPASHTLVWTFHHALLDGRCFPLLLGEVFEAYAEMEAGEPAARPEPPAYRRYIDWLGRQEAGRGDAFWKRMLEGFDAPTRLVVDREAHQHQSEVSCPQGEVWESLDAPATSKLRELAQEEGLSLNALMMGAWAILLHRYSGQSDIVFGATRACRKSSVEGAGETVGLFINTVPVRVRFERGDPALEVVRAARGQWLDMRPYEHTPLARVKALSSVGPAQPLFETLLVFENYGLEEAMRGLGGAWSQRRLELHELTNFPITLAAYAGTRLSFKIEFDRRRLEEGALARMLGHLRRILESMAADPRIAVRDIPLLTDSERDALVSGAESAAPRPSPRLRSDGSATLQELFEAQAARTPRAAALTSDGESLTYEELNRRANRLARRLSALGVGPETLVGLCLERSSPLIVGILGILKAGGAYLPIDLAYPQDRIAFMLEDARAPILLTETSLEARLPRGKARVVCVEDLVAGPAEPGEEADLPPSAGPDNLAYVIYTSGTTGKPKGSLITHRNAVRLFASTEGWFGFGESDVWTLFHSTAFDFSVWEIWGALLYGGRLVVVPFMVSRSPEAFYDLLVRERVTVLNQTPSAFRQLIRAEEAVGMKALALRYVIFGGEALEMQSLRPWFERHPDREPLLVNMYGITETTVHVTYRPLSRSDLDSGSVIGVPIPDLRIYVLDSDRQLVPVGVPGEMYVGGAGLARGYLGRPELTSERFVPDHLGRDGGRLYKTGDLARLLPGGDIEYLGRIDDQVKIRGFRIELGEIESVLCQHGGVRAAVVLAREDTPGTKRLVAYVVASGPAPGEAALREHLKKQLPEYMLPRAFVFLAELPLTPSGKVDRKALPAPENPPEVASAYEAPSTWAERKLAAIWEKVLRVPRVGVCDNFFELGGDSILSIQVVSLARREGFGMTPRLLFDNQTVRELAAAAGAAAERSPEEPVGGEVPLTPVQEWFFRQDPEEPHHYNQAFMFEVARRLDASVLERALEVVGHHHDGFRLRYRRDPAGWRQFYSETAGQVRLERVRTPETSSMESAAAGAEASLDIGSGPLGRAVYFESPNGEGDHLLLVVHHLVVDGVSWRILLEDLETAYRQIEAGEPVRLPEKTTSFGEWSRRLSALAASPALGSELGYWREVTDPAGVPDPDSGGSPGPPDTESAAQTLGVSLEPDLTQALLRRVPAAYHTGINDVLLAGLARAWSRWSGSEVLFANLEGHGREDLEGTDLSRTSGWFTSIFPVRLQLEGASGADWQPGEVLKRSKEHLGRVPGRGIGYGILRYLGDGADFSDRAEPSILVNYLGQLDALTAGSSLFRLSGGPTGPWHSPKQRRRYPLELNCQIRNGRLETAWTYSPSRHPRAAIEPLAAGFIEALGEIVAHCDAVGAGVGETSDFPLAGLDQEGVARLYAMGDVEDIYPLSPIQKLFHSSAPDPDYLGFDQWSSTLRGALDESAFRQAWEGTLARHPVLRSSIHSDGLPEPVQVVHGDPRPVWTVLDWRGMSPGEQASSWSGFLEADRARPLNLTEAPLMRFGLIRLAEERWKFVWSVPALLLDGWSWPLVFGDAGGLYDALVRSVPPALEPARPYRHYIEWLGRQSFGDSEAFWRRTLAGFREPTHLPLGAPDPETGGDRYVPLTMTLSEEATSGLASTARALRVTVPVLVQGAWALLVSRRSGDEDVCYGAAFAGRPADLDGVEGIVGPFVNNLPVRVALDPVVPLGQFLRGLHARLLELSTHQFMPMVDIQAASEVPWRHRLFESLVVFQNYRVGEAGRSFGGGIGIGEFAGPIHTNYRVLLLADPGDALALTLIYDRRSASGEVAEAWGRDLTALLERLPGALDARVGEVRAGMSPGAAPAPAPAAAAAGARGVGHLAPRTEMERVIAGVWQTLLGIERIGVDANVFDIGGSSLLLVRAHGGICEALGRRFPVVTLFEYPTVQSLARHLGGSPDDRGRTGQELRDRAERQRGALARIRAASEE